MKHFIKYWFPVLFYMAFIWFLSSRTLPTGSEVILLGGTLLHILEFFILAFLLFRAIYVTVEPEIAYPLTLLIAGSFGILDELHQGTVGRVFSYYDILADAIGVIIALLVQSSGRKLVKRAMKIKMASVAKEE